MADLSSEGSPSVPQQPVQLCPCGHVPAFCHRENARKWCGSGRDALAADRLAEAIKPLLGTMNYHFGPGARTLTRLERVEQYRELVAALEAFESGGATKPGEET